MKKLSLATAVLATVSDFASRKSDFSAFDVTRKLRKDIDAGELIVLDNVTENSQGRETREILHYSQGGKEGVREIVQDIFKQNDMTGYNMEDTGPYVLYTYNDINKRPAVGVVGAVNSFDSLATELQSAMQQVVETNTPQVTATQNVLDRAANLDPIDLAIVNYVGRNLSIGYHPTLKEVQSTLRRKGKYTCDEINKRIAALGDYSVNLNGPLSKATVSKK